MNERLRERRKALGFSQQRLAEEAGLSISSVFNIEHGYTPNSDTASQLAQALDCRPDDLWADPSRPLTPA